MRRYVNRLLMGAMILVAGGQLLQGGCIGSIQREIEILVAPEANLNEIYASVLVKVFGPGVLTFW